MNTVPAFVLLLCPFAACSDAPSSQLSAQSPVAAVVAAAAPQDPKPLPRARIDYTFVKTLFGKEPETGAVTNPSTPEKVALGRALYQAPLFANDASCATCHDLANYGADGKAVADGGKRNTPTTWNSFRQFRQGWDGGASTIEELGVHGLADDAALVAKVKAQPALVEAFGKAFPGGDATITAENVKLALGTFQRTLVTKSKWDEYLGNDKEKVAGNQKALTQDELFGLKTFLDIGCIQCHLGRLVGGQMFQKTGVIKPYSSTDEGRALLTKSDADKHFFKVPSLLNVDKTGPYLHDGKLKTLEEVVTLMADIQLDKKLTPDQVRGLVAFLKALTGPLPEEFAAKK